jgi:hypothetical protein
MSLLRMDRLDGETREDAARLLQVRLLLWLFCFLFFGNSKKWLSSVLYPMSTCQLCQGLPDLSIAIELILLLASSHCIHHPDNTLLIPYLQAGSAAHMLYHHHRDRTTATKASKRCTVESFRK